MRENQARRRPQQQWGKLEKEMSFVEKLYPLLAFEQREGYTPRIFHEINFFLIIFQEIMVFTWTIYNPTASVSDLNFLHNFLFVSQEYSTVLSVRRIILLFYSLIPIINTSSIVYQYLKNQTAGLFTIKYLGFCINILFFTALPALAANIGDSIYAFTLTRNLWFLFYGSIVFLLYITHIYISFFFINMNVKSIYIPYSPYVAYDSLYQFLFLYGSSFFIIPTFVGKINPSKAQYYSIPLLLLFLVFMTIRCFNIPFVVLSANSRMASFGAGMLAAILVHIFHIFNEMYLRFILCLIIITLSQFIFQKLIEYKFTKKLSSFHLEMTDQEAIDLLFLTLMDSGFSTKTEPIVSYLYGSKTITNEQKLMLAKYSFFFEEYHQIFRGILTHLKNYDFPNQYDSYLFYQLKSLESSQQNIFLQQELKDIQTDSVELSRTIREIWLEFGQNIMFDCFSVFESIMHTTQNLDQRWKELASKYPHSSEIADSYSLYLIECRSAFKESAKWGFIKEKLEEDHSVYYDQFKVLFLLSYPHFASKMAKDIKIVSFDEFDFRYQEKILAESTNFPKLSLELEKTLHETTNNNLNCLSMLSYLMLCMFLALWITASFLYYQTLNNRYEHSVFIYNTTLIGENLIFASFPLFLEIASIDHPSEIHDLKKSLNNYSSPIQMNVSFISTSREYAIKGFNLLNDVVTRIIEESQKGNHLNTIIDSISLPNISFPYFYNELGEVKYHFSTKYCFRDTLLYFFEISRFISSNVSNSWENNSSYFIESVILVDLLIKGLEPLSSSFIDNDIFITNNELSKHRQYWMITGLFSMIFFVFVYYFFHYRFRSFISKLSAVISGINQDSIIEVSKTFGKKESFFKDDIYIPIARIRNQRYFSIGLLILEFIATFILFGLFYLLYSTMISYHNEFNSIVPVVQNLGIRKTISLELLYSTIASHMIWHIPELRQYFNDTLVNIPLSVESFQKAHLASIQANYGYGDETVQINKIRTESTCPSENLILMDNYHLCLPLDSGIQWFITKFNELYPVINQESFLNMTTMRNVFQMSLGVMYDQQNEIPRLLLQYAKSIVDSFDSYLLAVSITGVFLTLSLFIISLFIRQYYLSVLNTAISFILRLSPADIFENESLLGLLTGNKVVTANIKSSYAQTLMDYNQPMIFVNKLFLIESINKPFQILFGFDLSHVIGKYLNFIFVGDILIGYLEKLKSGYYDGKVEKLEVECKKDNGEVINCEASIISIADKENANDQYYTIILVDKSNFTNLKAENEVLDKELNQIVSTIKPSYFRDFANGMVPQCTVCFIRISNFQDPKDRISMLSTFYHSIDELKTSASIHRIFLYNGVVVLVSVRQKDSYDHIPEVFSFAYRCMCYFRGNNLKADVCAGIHTGGPICMFFTEGKSIKTFLLGQIPDLAEKLLFITPPYSIGISEAVYEHVGNINVEFISETHDAFGQIYFAKQKVDNKATVFYGVHLPIIRG